MGKQLSKGAGTPAPTTAPTNAPKVALYVLGPKPANVRVAHNLVGWQAIQACLAANPKGATQAQLVLAVTPNNGFAWYAIKNQWLAKVS